jgi:hypothetical protein
VAKSSTNQKKLLRNWGPIAEVACQHTKYALSACKDPAVLSQLAAAFPECFRAAADHETDLVSWQRILRIAEKHHGREREHHPPFPELSYMWFYYLKEAHLEKDEQDLNGIPVLAQWGTTWFGHGQHAGIPRDILSQLHAMKGATIAGPLFLEYQNTRCVVGCIWSDVNGSLGCGEELTERFIDYLCELVLIPAHVIAFDC